MKVEDDILVKEKFAFKEIAPRKSVSDMMALLNLTESKNIIKHGISWNKKDD